MKKASACLNWAWYSHSRSRAHNDKSCEVPLAERITCLRKEGRKEGKGGRMDDDADERQTNTHTYAVVMCDV